MKSEVKESGNILSGENKEKGKPRLSVPKKYSELKVRVIFFNFDSKIWIFILKTNREIKLKLKNQFKSFFFFC